MSIRQAFREAYKLQLSLIVIFLIGLVLAGYRYIYLQKQPVKSGYQPFLVKGIPEVFPTITPFDIPGVYQGLTSFIPHKQFTIQYPPSCVAIEGVSAIRCMDDDYSVDIHPIGTGRTVTDPSRDIVTVRNTKWYRTQYVIQGKKGASYGREAEETYVLLEVLYEKYSVHGEKMVETILSTFRFI